MTLREKEGTRIWKITLKIVLSGELALQQTTDMFEDRIRKRDDIDEAVYWILFCIARVWIKEFLFTVFCGHEVRVALYRGLTVEAAASSETAVQIYWAEQLRIPEKSHPYYCGRNIPESDDVTVVWRLLYRVFILSRNFSFTVPARCMREMKLAPTHRTAQKINGGGAVRPSKPNIPIAIFLSVRYNASAMWCFNH